MLNPKLSHELGQLLLAIAECQSFYHILGYSDELKIDDDNKLVVDIGNLTFERALHGWVSHFWKEVPTPGKVIADDLCMFPLMDLPSDAQTCVHNTWCMLFSKQLEDRIADATQLRYEIGQIQEPAGIPPC